MLKDTPFLTLALCLSLSANWTLEGVGGCIWSLGPLDSGLWPRIPMTSRQSSPCIIPDSFLSLMFPSRTSLRYFLSPFYISCLDILPFLLLFLSHVLHPHIRLLHTTPLSLTCAGLPRELRVSRSSCLRRALSASPHFPSAPHSSLRYTSIFPFLPPSCPSFLHHALPTALRFLFLLSLRNCLS